MIAQALDPQKERLTLSSLTLMAVFAHPDDEAFGTGGTLSKYADEGCDVYLVTATRGEAGEIAEPDLATSADLPFVREHEVHLHVPAGAIPKDGPSAGVTLVTALISVLTRHPVREDVGMTGEVTLQGRVLPIGGVKQKVLAAHRQGLKTVILPKANEVDLDDVPEEIRDELTFELVDHVDEVLELAFESELDIESVSVGGNGRQKEPVGTLS
jgi:ATP-dependent Lon protease